MAACLGRFFHFGRPMEFNETQHQTSDDERRARALSLTPSRPPLQVPGYEPRKFLGAGAYGEVWVALDRNTGRQVAIKFYAHQGGLDWSILSHEVEKLAFLSADRYVVQLLDVGWDAQPPYYVMEYVEQGSLEDLLARAGEPAAPRRYRAVSRRGRGLAARARQGRVALRPEAGQHPAGSGQPAAAGRLRSVATLARTNAGPGHVVLHGPGAGRLAGRARRAVGRLRAGSAVVLHALRCAAASQRHDGRRVRFGPRSGRSSGPIPAV